MTCMATLSIPGFDCISTKTEYHEVLTLMSKPSPSIPNFFITGRAVDFSRSTWQGTVRLNPDAHPCACRELKTTFQNPRINPVSSQQQADAVQFPWQHLSPMSSIHTSQGFLFCMICWQYLIWNNAPWRKGLKRTIQRLACVQRMWQKKGVKGETREQMHVTQLPQVNTWVSKLLQKHEPQWHQLLKICVHKLCAHQFLSETLLILTDV